MAASSLWADRTLVALAGLPADPAPTIVDVVEEVAIRFADTFAPADRDYPGTEDSPRWHGAVRAALDDLRAGGLVGPDSVPTADGLARAATVAPEFGTEADDEPPPTGPPAGSALVLAGVIAPPLRSADSRAALGFDPDEDVPVPVMAEVNLRHAGGAAAAFDKLERLWARVTGGERAPVRLADQYVAGELTMHEIERLVAADAAPVEWSGRGIYRVWPDFPVHQHVDVTRVTIKADAAQRAFNAYGEGIVWAVVDSGVDATHPHFTAYRTLEHESVRDLHRTFPVAGLPTAVGALEDESGHGTHVAGIIAGAVGPWVAECAGRAVLATESRFNVENPTRPLRAPRSVSDPAKLAGMAPKARLVSLKVLGVGGTVQDRVHRVVQALAYVREVNGQSLDGMRIHGVNLSIGYEFDPQWFACGRSPLCQEVDKLVRSGVVVVVAAGNSGYGTLAVPAGAPATFGLGMTINDPGNAERAITVGSTHRDAPVPFGVSYFSSKGPTGDGREKPDVVAPGERITSCAAGANLTAVLGGPPRPDTAVYVDDSGTSMAAPHVSGAIAALLSVRRDLVGDPDEVKSIVVGAATDLGRRREFQGGGIVDLMRALQFDPRRSQR